MGKTILVAFALEAESDADTLYQSYHIKKDGIITHLHFDAVLASGGAVQFKIMRDQHSVQVWPEAPSPRSGDLIGDDFHFHDVYYQDLNLEVFEPVRKGEEYRLWAYFAKDTSNLHCIMTILPVDAITVKLHRESIKEIAGAMQHG